jgi:predicted nucleic-acid-binding Zn-ribbon protein
VSSHSLTCPKCNSDMEQGFVLDRTYGTQNITKWSAGPPQKELSFGLWWTGTTPSKSVEVPMATFRCSGCGYLESYARPEFEAQ